MAAARFFFLTDMADATKQPELEYQRALDSIMEATPDVVQFRGRSRRIGWLHRHTERKFTHIVLTEKDVRKRNVKLCACVLTNGVFAWFKPIVYFFRWRWYWYVADLDDVEVLRVLDASKKKIQYNASLLITILATEMKDVMMTMTKSEAESTRAARSGERGSD